MTATPPQETLMTHGFGPTVARSKTLMSVHFERKTHQFFHSRRRSFVLEPAARDRPTFCTVYDSQQIVPDTGQLAALQPGEPHPQDLAMPVPVEFIVQDLLRLWSRANLGVAAKTPCGIIALAGDQPTKQEIAKAVAMEDQLCRALVLEADGIHQGKEGRIEKRHRDALGWMGSERREWFEEIQIGVSKMGAISSKRIPMEALVDGGLPLMAFYIENGLHPEDFGDTYVANMWKNKPSIVQTLKERLFPGQAAKK